MSRIPLGIEKDAPGNYQAKLNNREKKVIEALRLDQNIDIDMKSPVIVSAADNVGVPLPSEAAAALVVPMIVDNVPFVRYLSVVESTGTAVYAHPYVSTDGLEIVLDANVTDGVTACELGHGIISSNPAKFTVGSFPGGSDTVVFIEADILIDDISDLDQLFVGFRKLEAFQAEPDNYDELAAIHVGETGATVADGQINIATILNNAATTYTDTTLTDWADAAQKKLRVEINNLGQCTFLVAGSVPTVTKIFAFDAGEVIIPFMFFENTSGSTTGDPGVTLVGYKVGIK
jgi:hypothetical protein